MEALVSEHCLAFAEYRMEVMRLDPDEETREGSPAEVAGPA